MAFAKVTSFFVALTYAVFFSFLFFAFDFFIFGIFVFFSLQSWLLLPERASPENFFLWFVVVVCSSKQTKKHKLCIEVSIFLGDPIVALEGLHVAKITRKRKRHGVRQRSNASVWENGNEVFLTREYLPRNEAKAQKYNGEMIKVFQYTLYIKQH